MKLSIVSYLDDQVSLAVRKIQRDLSMITGSTASLKSWEPHITVGDGVEVDELQLERLKENVENLASNESVFNLNLRGIGSLDNWKGGAGETPYVIYLEVIINEKLLRIVQGIEQLANQYSKWYVMPRPYLPHCTLAFRDLTKDGYGKGLKYLEQLNPNLEANIDHIALVEKLPEIDRELIRFNLVK